MKWKPAFFEEEVVRQLIATQFHDYIKRVKETDCQAELRRLLSTGPPVYVSDRNGMPLDEDDSHVEKIWFASSNEYCSGRLDGAPMADSAERNELWSSLSQFLVQEGSDDEEEGGNNGTKS
mmetsp:Transcript_5333/g.8243  ORF Transcript_5333/g.8243 Transcript_5333/m.8243 type:complete len:121 (+) Transcript_5333:317-679(+)|eukprot:CAMPEP_0118683420 /NCGR_PEP_ID=MMETSP0800-20121206/6035_1 /TAXON_ID=210618 ORGANISM="Striatella unipunctata, Strain CCMP2910" /NCGR_SAMPLE_ID=MMETSP0800 /ASSEMBLY_ACC=CAM_ASM_000638 /LENGTH=120 /DNA_ID=CAMNT_0006579927 /DNA_START=280 /DNA_END=642 /DNA_ORIENTATION=+